MEKFVTIATGVVLIIFILLTTINSIKFFNFIYKKNSSIENNFVRYLVSFILSIIFGGMAIFGASYHNHFDERKEKNEKN